MAKKIAHECSAATRTEFHATHDHPYHFLDCGLPNVHLVGIRYFECQCGDKTVEIPAIKQLMALIARHIVMKRYALTGAEIRFLRKRLGQKAIDFSLRIKLQTSTLSRVENGKQSISEKADVYIRIYYAFAAKDPVLLDALKDALDRVLAIRHKTKSTKPQKTIARIEQNQWALEAAA